MYTQWVMAAVRYPWLKRSENSQSGHEDHTNNIYTDTPFATTLTDSLSTYQEQ